jgi:N-acetyl-alpha-D-glucosaminyl L-malate synthase BshA
VLLVGLEPSYYRITKYSIERSDGITAVSNYLRDATFKGFGIDKDIEVIYNFVDTSKFKPLPASEGSSREARVIHISNFRAVKRVQDVVHAFNLIRQRLPARLVMVGDGPEKEGVKELAGALGIEKNIEFMNTISDVSEVLAKADLFLLPSQIESFGLAACEAMSCGVPVVAYNVGGLPEVIESGVDGYLVELGDIKGMAEIGLKILNNPSVGSEVGRRARAKVVERFSQDKIIDRYEDYYRRIVGAGL